MRGSDGECPANLTPDAGAPGWATAIYNPLDQHPDRHRRRREQPRPGHGEVPRLHRAAVHDDGRRRLQRVRQHQEMYGVQGGSDPRELQVVALASSSAASLDSRWLGSNSIADLVRAIRDCRRRVSVGLFAAPAIARERDRAGGSRYDDGGDECALCEGAAVANDGSIARGEDAAGAEGRSRRSRTEDGT
jgi:hypothetical protein